MARKNARTTRLTRRDKLRQERIAELAGISADHTVEFKAPSQMPRFEPANQNQRRALALLENNTPITILAGAAGSGKSLVAAYRAATLLKTKQIDKIYLVRPAVGVGKTIGLLPGDISLKMGPYFAQTITHLERYLGKGFVTYCLEKQVIQMLPIEYCRGLSLERCFVLAEECQNLTHEEFQMLLTRFGEGSTACFTGDQSQNDLKRESGLKTTVDLINMALQTQPDYLSDDDLDALDEQVGVVMFTPDDVVRSGLTRAFVKLYHFTS